MVLVFPKISLKPEVEAYLLSVFKNKEILATLQSEQSTFKFETLLSRLSHPPAFTCIRVNTCAASTDEVKKLLREEIQKQRKGWPMSDIPVLEHPELPDVLLIPVIGPRINLQRHSIEVVVGAQCGNAVLRGAHVFIPGILSAPKLMKAGGAVSVYSDISGKCKRGAVEFVGSKIFVGNGIAEISRNEIFCSNCTLRGVGIRMTEPVYISPSFDNILSSFVFLQGEVIAMDKIANKVKKIKQNAENLQLKCIKVFCYDGTKALAKEGIWDGQAGPPFPPESFDRILLDAPCSGLGQRPNMACDWSLKEITSYPPLQRKLFRVAVNLLKPGGILVYSTCTITLAENEEQVAWALDSFPCLSLQPQEPHLGEEGMMGAGLSYDQRKLLQRFDPASVTEECTSVSCSDLDSSQIAHTIKSANKDTIGFFIAKFMKMQAS
ncbi:tRNA (cytosine(72)-C(5))-methyltransferase NSUN6 isoform X2 [Stegostoma tigrinum]|uniref:tRNA (cytosine(72)-C(5))-methyltransferase NSUN6 isoform X2 n=1 Tax=Stegostoma tigrinum TaxID=3053191 RepID=UPI00202B95AF|nr:tRNA (cytosine(72)-C(5))-methyltransferase NSUN6 isoform X2 [Stegostoma tigrinum]